MFKSKYRRKYEKLCNCIKDWNKRVQDEHSDLEKTLQRSCSLDGSYNYMYCCGEKIVLDILKEKIETMEKES